MKKYWLLGAVCLFLPSISGYSALAQETRGPKMVVRERVFDSKEVKEGEVIVHTFRVLNQGGQTLKIIRVKPG